MKNLSILKFGYGLSSKLALFAAMVRLKLVKPKPFTCSLTLDGKHSVLVHLAGTGDEFTILRDLCIANEYAAPESMEVKTILDLGANIGVASAWFRLTYPAAKIHAYEPAPRAFALLQENAKHIGNMQVFAEAIGAHAGEVTFHESDRSVASSVITSNALQTSHDVSVPMISIDAAIERMDSVDLLKIDIEGAEFDALAAAAQLHKAKYIVGEAHPAAAKRNLAEIEKALSKMHTVTIKPGERLAGFYAILK